MIKKTFLLVMFFSICSMVSAYEKPIQLKKYNIGLCVMATGKYDKYAIKMIDSARKFFLNNHNVSFFVFTDQDFPNNADVTSVFQKRLGWPNDTLKRFHVYYKNKSLFDKMDYLFAIDADMLFVAPVGDEILGSLVATQHPGFVDKRGSYETNKKSTAYVEKKEGKCYFAGGFYGGKKDNFIKLLKSNIDNIEKDLKKDYIAVWHDESHLNRYLINNKPDVVLSPSYCYPESWNLPYEKKLLALDKNHEEIRK